MQIVIAGSSGFLGQLLMRRLRQHGHHVTALVRRTAGDSEAAWDPYAGDVPAGIIEQADVVVNLAGSPTAGNPHSKKWASELRRSRVTTTRVLAEAIAASSSTPAFLAGNGISYYGDHGDQPLPEDADSRGNALLTSVTHEWQAATEPAREAGSRVVVLRTSPVLDKQSPPLKQLALLFKAGLGGRLGKGQQYFPVISARDWVSAVTFAAETDLDGPVNLCCAQTPTNAEFTEALAAALHRPAVFTVPGPLLSKAAGAMAPEILGSVRAVPQRLLDAGFGFADPDIEAVVASGLASRR